MAVNVKKINTTVRHMLTHSVPGPGVERMFLQVKQEKTPVTYLDLADFLDLFDGEYTCFPDTNIFTAHPIPKRFWQSLILKTFGLTQKVFSELGPWMRCPKHNQSMVELIKASTGPLTNGSLPVYLDTEENWPQNWQLARQYYTTLLSSRKDFAISIVEKFKRKHNRDPSNAELNSQIQRMGADRDVKLMQKAIESGITQNWWTDEDLVVTAVLTALFRGRPSWILTR